MSSFAVYERYYAGDQEPLKKRITDKPAKKSGTVNLNKLLSFLIMLLSLMLVGELVFHLVISPRLTVQKVQVHSDGYCPLSDEEILKIAGLERPLSYLSVSERGIADRLMASPMIKTAQVHKRFPDTVTIAISARKALASIFAEVDGKSRLLYVDSQGYILSSRAVEGNASMPVLSGVRLLDIRPGMRFPDELVGYLNQLDTLNQKAPRLYNLISEIKFVKKSTAGYEVVLFPGHEQLRVRTGPELSEEMMRSILLVIDVVKRQGLLGSLAELDFRTGDVVYRARGIDGAER